jgi:hypothetical protein
VLLSVSDDVVIETEFGIEIIRRDQIRQFSLPPLAERPATRPTLTWLLNVSQAGDHDLQVTYLTEGISWQADYTALLSENDTRMSLDGWVSVTNTSGSRYEDARVKLVAGELNRVQEKVYEEAAFDRAVELAAAAPSVAQRAVGDYHLYEIERPVTIEENQTKQVEFSRSTGVAVEKQYVLNMTAPIWIGRGSAITDAGYGTVEQGEIAVQVHVTNSDASGLGMPLPAGTVRIYTEDTDGSAVLVGEDMIDHTPRDETIRLSLGNAFDLVGERRQTSFRQLGERSIEETIEVTLRNQSEEDVTIQVIEHLFRAHDAEITDSSLDYESLDANTIQFSVPVESGGEETVTYTVVYRW